MLPNENTLTNLLLTLPQGQPTNFLVSSALLALIDIYCELMSDQSVFHWLEVLSRREDLIMRQPDRKKYCLFETEKHWKYVSIPTHESISTPEY